jgi:hypothetical protein
MSKMSTLMVPLLKEILMKEIGESNIPSLNWKQVSPTRYKFLIDIGEFTERVTVQFENFDQDLVSKQFYLPAKFQSLNKTYNVAYDVSGDDIQFSQSDIKTLLTVLSTVTAIIKDFITSENPDVLYIEATEKLEGKIQKSNLYKAYILQQLKTIPGYQAESRRKGELIFKK